VPAPLALQLFRFIHDDYSNDDDYEHKERIVTKMDRRNAALTNYMVNKETVIY